MFRKVLAIVVVVFMVQVFGGTIKAKISPEIQKVITEIDMKALVVENELKTTSADKKHEIDTVKLNTKMVINELKLALKAGKGTLCGSMATLQSKEIEMRANEVKECNNKVNMKELRRDLNTFFKNLHNEALLADRYCGFICTDEAEVNQCVQSTAASLRSKLEDVETVLGASLKAHLEESTACLNAVSEDVQLGSAKIQLEMANCLNPTTTEAHTTEDSSEEKGSDESNENGSNSNSGEHSEEHSGEHSGEHSEEHSAEHSDDNSGEGSNAASKAPEDTSEAGSGNNASGEHKDEEHGSEQVTEDGHQGEEGNHVPCNTEVPLENKEENKEEGTNADENKVEENHEEQPKKDENKVEENHEEQPKEDENKVEENHEEAKNEENHVEENKDEHKPAQGPSDNIPVEEAPIEEHHESNSVGIGASHEIHVAEIKEEDKPVDDADEINIEY